MLFRAQLERGETNRKAQSEEHQQRARMQVSREKRRKGRAVRRLGAALSRANRRP